MLFYLQIVLWALLALLLGLVAWYRYWDLAVDTYTVAIAVLNADLPEWVWKVTKWLIYTALLLVNLVFFTAIFYYEAGLMSAVLFLTLMGLLSLYRPKFLRNT